MPNQSPMLVSFQLFKQQLKHFQALIELENYSCFIHRYQQQMLLENYKTEMIENLSVSFDISV